LSAVRWASVVPFGERAIYLAGLRMGALLQRLDGGFQARLLRDSMYARFERCSSARNIHTAYHRRSTLLLDSSAVSSRSCHFFFIYHFRAPNRCAVRTPVPQLRRIR